jgi:DNA-binding transcriptional ArsR family regulator
MKDLVTLKDLKQLKALSDPLRRRILECFSAAPATTKQIADQLGENPTKLYHHVEKLLKAGLVELVETRQNRGTVERYYQATAKKFAVDQQLLSPSPKARAVVGALQSVVVNAMQAGLSDAQENFTDLNSLGPANLPIAAKQARIRTSQKKILKLIEKLQKFGKECQAAHDDAGELEYSLTLTLFPIKTETVKETGDSQTRLGSGAENPVQTLKTVLPKSKRNKRK